MSLDPFTAHGFEVAETAGNQVVGDCLFCGKEHHYYVNPESGQWDCKSCGLSGNLHGFLRQLVELHRAETSRKDWRRLSRLRGLPVEVLKEFDMAFDRDNGRWLFPVRNPRGTVCDVRYWRENGNLGVRSTKGCKLQLMGAERLSKLDPGGEVWICEGEWDAMAVHDLLMADHTKTNAAVVALPGAGTFKQHWIPGFSGHNVVLVYDNDDAGLKGAEKAWKKLKSTTRTLRVVEWEGLQADLPDGYDARDFYTDALEEIGLDKLEALDKLEGLLTRRPPGQGSSRGEDGEDGAEFEPHDDTEAIQRVEVGAVPPEDIPALSDVLREFELQGYQLNADMRMGFRIAAAHAFANQLPGDPLWSFIVGPPGCGKTLLLMSMQGSDRCIFQSTFTPNSLVSGFRSEYDPSQLPQWDGKCAVLKDFTELLACHKQVRDDVYAILRGAYDGHVKKPFGNGVVREYWIRFSMLAGVTPQIHADRQASLGERFLKFEMARDHERQSFDQEILAAIESVGEERAREIAVCDAVGRFLSRDIAGELGRVPGWVKERLVALAQLISALRANVAREQFGDQRLSYRPTKEVGTRIAKQLVLLGKLLCCVDGVTEIGEEQYEVVERVALDSAIGFHLELVSAVVRAGGSATRADLTDITGLPETTLSRAMEDLGALGIVRRGQRATEVSGARGRPRTEWTLNKKYNTLWRRAFPEKKVRVKVRRSRRGRRRK